MKILEIIPSLRPGGGERLVTDLCNELSKSQKVILLTLWDDNQQDFDFYKPDLSENIQYINAKVNEQKKLKILWTFVKYIYHIKPDIIHLHMCHMFALLALLLLGWKYKFYLTIHNDIRLNYAKRKHKIIFNFFGRLGWLHFITISQTNYKDFNIIYPKLKNNLVYNGRAPLYKTNKYPDVIKEIKTFKVTNQTKIFLHIARCNPQKNQQLLIKSFNKLISEGFDATLLIIGAHFNDSKAGKELQQIACDKIHFLGTRTNVSDYIFNADAFCLSSLFEGMPITVIECVNTGIPIISTPVCGVIDIIKDGQNGIISKNYDISSYTESLKRFFIEESQLKNKSLTNMINNPFTIESCSDNYLRIFKSKY